MNKKDDIPYKAAKIILLIFIMFNVISYLYALFTGTYNGDYLGAKVKLSQWELLLNLLYTITPFFVLFAIYRYYRKIKTKYKITIPLKAVETFLVFLIIFQIIVTILYGVNQMGGRETYQAPWWIKIFIQKSNKFNLTIGIFYFLILSKRRKIGYFYLCLVLLLSFLRVSLGVLAPVSLFFIIQYYEKSFRLLKKYFLIVVIGLIISPFIIAFLFDYREELRKTKGYVKIATKTKSELFFGQLIGRLSSYSNSAIIMERKKIMTDLTAQFPFFQCPLESLTAIYAKIIDDNNKIAYKNIMLRSEGVHSLVRSVMIGTQGCLLLGYYQSFFVLLVNLSTMFVLVICTFKLASLLRYENMKELIFMFFCFRIMSGSVSEYTQVFIATLSFVMFFMAVNSFKKETK